MNRDEVMEKARGLGWVVEPCASPEFIGVRAYKPDTNECMRFGAGGELYTKGKDGWMYQVGTVEDVAKAVQTKLGESK